MSRSIMESTQVNITLSVQIDTDYEAELFYLLLFLFFPVRYLFKLWHSFNQFRSRLRLWWWDVKDMLTFIGAVIGITIKSFAYGLGIGR
ncbi:MAG: hypothetical protein FOGNACKC_02866 [Anaerolineae bacterium]|nr:hypothetical protein [Anaerolineae bacterium]